MNYKQQSSKSYQAFLEWAQDAGVIIEAEQWEAWEAGRQYQANQPLDKQIDDDKEKHPWRYQS